MQVAARPAIPAALPRSGRAAASRDRLLRWVANAVTVLAAVIAIVVVGIAAVMIGIT